MKKQRIEALFRFSALKYDEKHMKKRGIEVFDFYFDDGTYPKDSQIQEFLEIVSK